MSKAWAKVFEDGGWVATGVTVRGKAIAGVKLAATNQIDAAAEAAGIAGIKPSQVQIVVNGVSMPVPADVVLTQHLVEIHKAFTQLMAGPLKLDTLVLLLQESSKVPKNQIKKVLAALSSLPQDHLKDADDGPKVP